jgi:hypothetical protein
MGNFTFNIAKGRIRTYLELPAAADAVLLVLLKSGGLEADATLKDYDDLSALLAAANDECDFTGYARRTITPSAPTVDDTNERVDIDGTDPASYTNSGGAAQDSGKAILVYDNDTGAGTDANIIPLLAWDCVLTFNVGVATTVAFNAAGMARITD